MYDINLPLTTLEYLVAITSIGQILRHHNRVALAHLQFLPIHQDLLHLGLALGSKFILQARNQQEVARLRIREILQGLLDYVEDYGACHFNHD